MRRFLIVAALTLLHSQSAIAAQAEYQRQAIKLAIEIPDDPSSGVLESIYKQAVRALSDQVMMEQRWQGTRREVRSYLSEILDIVNGTGRRITPVCSLRYQDLRLDQGKYGVICWPADTDKVGKETVVPISPEVRAALDRVLEERPGIGAAYLFPSPVDPNQPVRYERASQWLQKAEGMAELPKQKGSLWHAYRRKWATERKHLPDVDVAAAGGWTETSSLKRCYQQADEATMLEVVLGGGELRESRG